MAGARRHFLLVGGVSFLCAVIFINYQQLLRHSFTLPTRLSQTELANPQHEQHQVVQLAIGSYEIPDPSAIKDAPTPARTPAPTPAPARGADTASDNWCGKLHATWISESEYARSSDEGWRSRFHTENGPSKAWDGDPATHMEGNHENVFETIADLGAPMAVHGFEWHPRIFGQNCCAKSFRNGKFWGSLELAASWELLATVTNPVEGAQFNKVLADEPKTRMQWRYIKFSTSRADFTKSLLVISTLALASI